VKNEYKVVKEYRVKFDRDLFEEKMVEVLEKYDFLVGDFSDGSLRLKGFFSDSRRAPRSLKASSIEDYLKKSCAYMCPHYVVEKVRCKELGDGYGI